MRIYVWSGPNVLENYGTGLVIVAAENMSDAWDKLRTQNLDVWFRIVFGVRKYMFAETYEEAMRHLDIEDINSSFERGFPVYPTSYAIEDLPIIVQQGGE